MKQCAVQAPAPRKRNGDRQARRAFLGAVGVAGSRPATPSPGGAGDEFLSPCSTERALPAHARSARRLELQRASPPHTTASPGASTNLGSGLLLYVSSPVDGAGHLDGLDAVPPKPASTRAGEDTDREDSPENARAWSPRPSERTSTSIAVTHRRGDRGHQQRLIGGYNRLKPGDAAIYADLDYPAMQYAMNWLADRRGVRVVRIAIPEPATRDNVLGAYRAALDANPDVRLLLLTHVNNKTGLILPVATITEFARRRNVDVIVDAAHSWGQLDLSVADVGADFIGFNLHKWVGAPIGVGVIYIRKGRLNDIDRMMADEDQPADSIMSRVHTGTMNFAAVLTVPAALDFHVSVGPAYKAARLRYLRDRWVNAVRGFPGLEILTPDDPDMAAAITSFRIRGRTSRADNDQLVDALLKQHGLFTVRRTGIEQGDCVRVTPALYNRPEDVDRLALALKQLSRQGR